MKNKLLFRSVLIIAVLIISLYYTFPLGKRINLGLDLKGGMHLVLQVDTSKLSDKEKYDAVDRAIEVVRNRIDQFGVSEPVIQRQGENGIVVQLPGVTDRKRAIDLIGKTALLEFKLVSQDPEALKQAVEGNVAPEYELKYIKEDSRSEPLLLHKEAVIMGDALTTASAAFDSSRFGEPIVRIAFNPEGAKKFAQITKDNVGRQLAIVLDGNVQSAPRINEPIPSGEAVISGRFNVEKAQDLAIVLRVGALPAPMRIEEERTIGPLLGQDSVKSGIKASAIGGSIVLAFMIVYYLLSGLVASIALIFNLFIILGTLGLLPVILSNFSATLTLPGIAGIVLTLGMAVDANVLINERIREELRSGKSLRSSISSGYGKAFSAILDSNITTLIAAFFLFQFGTGPIRGFAVTLTIGLMASMFTAIVVTRHIFELLLLSPKFTSLRMLNFARDTKIDFIAKRKICYVVSAIVITAGLVSFAIKGKDAYGIDFSEGQIQEYAFKEPIAMEDLRSALISSGLQDASIQKFKDNPKVVMIRTKTDTSEAVSEIFGRKFPANTFEIMRIENVGPSVGKQLRGRAIWAILWAMAGILVYVGIRFKHFDFAIAGVIALLHDVFVAMGVLLLTGRQIDLLIVTALLTIAGYSINDTIVIYDRVRENARMLRKYTLRDLINLSVNQTMSRTILTSLLTLFVVLALFLYGGEVLHSFSFVLIVGFISGVYSTVFIASALVLAWNRRKTL
ncbi:MAG: protein translocase subunit SecD [Candidatus Omnitrophica bacterium]|nr:protein translocase subunit SecD [Candidatus Omnitrophota bacterium]